MQKSPNCDNLGGEKPKSLTNSLVLEIERKLNEGYLVELMRLRDGRIVARTVKKKEITVTH